MDGRSCGEPGGVHAGPDSAVPGGQAWRDGRCASCLRRWRAHALRVAFSASCSARHCTLPVPDLGSESANWTMRGAL